VSQEHPECTRCASSVRVLWRRRWPSRNESGRSAESALGALNHFFDGVLAAAAPNCLANHERRNLVMADRDRSNLRDLTQGADERVLAHNLEQMDSAMMSLLNVESIGGNAGFVRIRGRTVPCAAARGFANLRSGEIIVFGNYQDIPKKIRNTCAEFIFRVAMDVKRRPSFSRIVGCSACGPFTREAKRILRTSVVRWNAERGVRPRTVRRRDSSTGPATRR
jgi:hypothetical protein